MIYRIVFRYLLVCCWALAGSCCRLNAQQASYMFKRLGVNDGLSNNQINAVYKDSRGNMWFGTASGLNRFDGFNFKVFVNRLDDPTSLADSYIEEIQELEDGSLLLRTPSGYTRMIRDTQTFENVSGLQKRWQLPAKPELVKIDSYKNVWSYLEGKGIYLYRPSDRSSFLFSFGHGNGQLPPGKIASIVESSEGVILGYENGLLVGLNSLQKTRSFVEDHIYRRHYEGVLFYEALEDGDQNLWVVSPAGLHVRIAKENRWYDSLEGIGVQSEVSLSLKDDMIKCIAKDHDGNIWVGTDRRGLLKINLKQKRVWNYQSVPDDNRSLTGNSVETIYVDRDDVLWVGTYKDGVNYYGASIFKFKQLNLKDITYITESPDGNICFTSSKGFYVYNPRENTQKHYQKGDQGLDAEVFVCATQSRSGDLWLGTFRGGLVRFRNGRFQTFRHRDGDPSSLANDNIWTLAEDPEGLLWIGTLGSGVQCLDPRTEKFVAAYKNEDGLCNDYISSLFVTRDHKILVGTTQGLSILDLQTRKIERLLGNRRGTHKYTNCDVIQAIEDSRGLIWVATRQGLNVWDPVTDNIYIFPEEFILQNQQITAVVEDMRHNMWVTSSNGAVNILVNETGQKREFSYQTIYYDERDGLQGREFNRRSILCCRNGDIMMGGPYGVNAVNPEQIQFNRVLPNVSFSGLLLFNEEVKIGKEYDGRVILPADLNELSILTLDYTQNVVTFLLGSDNFSLSEKMSFRYKLDGFNDDWLIGEPSQSRITYTNLAPGTYVLRVKAVNSDGYASEKERLLTVIITPPFWRSWIAYLFYVLFIVVALVLLWQYVKSNRLIRRKLKKLERIYAEKKELERQLVDSGNRFLLSEDLAPVNKVEAANDEEKPRSILIVDDNDDYLALLESCLRKHYRVYCAHDGVKALDLIHKELPDLMICDDRMPRMSGRDLYQIVREEYRIGFLPVIMLFAASDDSLSLDLFRFGVDDYVVKPFDVEELMVRIGHLLQSAGSRRSDNLLRMERVSELAQSGWLKRVWRIVEEHLPEVGLSVEKVGLAAGVSRLPFYEKILEATGMSPLEFILCVRLKRAGELLADGVLGISEIATRTGFRSLNNFTRSFKEVYGMVPSVYRELKERNSDDNQSEITINSN